ncbi:hypothetical protein HG531_002463 [Fusarium graminearum]|nr:hypothetical protein HG531_002463 [Fusarium graminearum]
MYLRRRRRHLGYHRWCAGALRDPRRHRYHLPGFACGWSRSIVGVVGLLASVVERVLVVVSPERVLVANLAGNVVGELRTEAEGVDDVGEVVGETLGHVPVVLKIVNVHVAAAETSSGSEMEVTNDLVYAQASLNTAALATLRIQLLTIVLTLTLLNTLAAAKGPRGLGIGFTDFVTSLTTACLLSVGGRCSTVAATTGLGIDNGASLALGLETDFVDTMHNTVLLLARDIHDIKRQELAGHLGKVFDSKWRIYFNGKECRCRTSSLVHNQLRMYIDATVVCPFAPRQEQDHQQRHDGDDTTAGRSNSRFIDSLGKGVKPCKS